MQIEECIQYVLLQEQYVSLPGIGSFVREVRPAQLDPQGRLLPTTQCLRFSNDRKFDDEALRNYLRNHSTLPTEEVEEILMGWLDTLRARIEKGETIHFQGIGTLRKEGKQLRLAGEGSNLQLTATGLLPLILPKEKGIGKRKVRRTNLWVVALICGVVASGGTIATYFLASPSHFKKRPAATPAVKKDSLITPTLPPLDSTEILQETQQILDSSHRQVNALRVQPEPKQGSVFFIVVGSFTSSENAHKLERELTQKGYTPTVRKINGMYRVTLGKYYDKKSGIREMNKRRKELQNDALWLIEAITNE